MNPLKVFSKYSWSTVRNIGFCRILRSPCNTLMAFVVPIGKSNVANVCIVPAEKYSDIMSGWSAYFQECNTENILYIICTPLYFALKHALFESKETTEEMLVGYLNTLQN